MDGLGAFQTFSDPAAGQGFTHTVPAGHRWRVWGGSCQIVTTATAGNRNPFLTFKNANTTMWVGGQDDPGLGSQPAQFVPASSTRRLVFYDFRQELRQTFAGTFLPVGCKAVWLPAGTDVTLTVQNIDTADQISQVGFLIEDATV